MLLEQTKLNPNIMVTSDASSNWGCGAYSETCLTTALVKKYTMISKKDSQPPSSCDICKKAGERSYARAFRMLDLCWVWSH